MARSKKILGMKPTTLGILAVSAYLLKDKIFKKPVSPANPGTPGGAVTASANSGVVPTQG